MSERCPDDRVVQCGLHSTLVVAMILRRSLFAAAALVPSLVVTDSAIAAEQVNWRYDRGAVVRGNIKAKRLALVFTGDEHSEGTAAILDALKARDVRGSFFLTGRFVRNPKLRPFVQRMIKEQHYVGPHSDSHPHYADWEDRNRSLVTEEFFKRDLQKNIDRLRFWGALPQSERVMFIPPFEWYNEVHVEWSREMGVELINFTPGSGSNRDYVLEDDPKFVPSRTILREILNYETKDPHGLNGFLLLTHLGSARKDAFHKLLPELLEELTRRGYKFVRVDELLGDTNDQ